eukprot:2265542-Prymnesium_polylepis.1
MAIGERAAEAIRRVAALGPDDGTNGVLFGFDLRLWIKTHAIETDDVVRHVAVEADHVVRRTPTIIGPAGVCQRRSWPGRLLAELGRPPLGSRLLRRSRRLLLALGRKLLFTGLCSAAAGGRLDDDGRIDGFAHCRGCRRQQALTLVQLWCWRWSASIALLGKDGMLARGALPAGARRTTWMAVPVGCRFHRIRAIPRFQIRLTYGYANLHLCERVVEFSWQRVLRATVRGRGTRTWHMCEARRTQGHEQGPPTSTIHPHHSSYYLRSLKLCQ